MERWRDTAQECIHERQMLKSMLARLHVDEALRILTGSILSRWRLLGLLGRAFTEWAFNTSHLLYKRALVKRADNYVRVRMLWCVKAPQL